ncbi:MAG: hypothetical protein E7140_04325 [Rikenellaceae bacterium]|nr:hypothetical protein [Rikenellaceae bacterium]
MQILVLVLRLCLKINFHTSPHNHDNLRLQQTRYGLLSTAATVRILLVKICILNFEFCILNFEFCILHFAFCILNFEFCILNFEFCILHFAF